MKIEIFGPGCHRCHQLADNAREAAKQMGLAAEIVKITDVQEMVKRGIMGTPALVVDGVVKSTGKVLSPQEIMRYLG